jgi:hypothetical protein
MTNPHDEPSESVLHDARLDDEDGSLTEPKYLDLDGDGVPDAVQTVRVNTFDITGDGIAEAIEVIQEVDAEIDDDGAAHRVTVTDTLELDVEHDGHPVVIEITSHAARNHPSTS